MMEVVSILNYFKEPIISLTKDIKDELIQLMDVELKYYLNSTLKKFGKTKTFLFRHKRIDFYDVYYPINLKYLNEDIDTNKITNLFIKSKFCSIIGYAGAGKSMLLKHLFLNIIKNKEAIPIIIELRNINNFDGTITDYISTKLLGFKFGANTSILERMLKSGKFIFLLDGYDEIHKKDICDVTSQINSFIDLYHNNRMIITSRPGADVELLPRFDNFYIKSLSKNDTKKFIEKQLKIRWNDDSELLFKNIIKAIEDEKNKSIQNYLKNPLLLSMFILTFELKPEIPKRKSEFYANVFDVLCLEHNALSKSGYSHNKVTRLTNGEIEEVLMVFSFVTFIKGAYIFNFTSLKQNLNNISKRNYKNIIFEPEDIIRDLTVAIPIILKEGLEYKFIHRSMQEYFASLFIKNMDFNNKKKMYKDNFFALTLKSSDSLYNFWKLCYELDKTAFLEHFILPTLNDFLNKINFNSEKEKIESFLQIINYEYYIEFNKTQVFDYGNFEYNSNLAVDIKNGAIIKSKTSNDFKPYQKVLNFLNLFKTHQISELINLRTLSNYYNFEWKDEIFNPIPNFYDAYPENENLSEKELGYLLNTVSYENHIEDYGYYETVNTFIKPYNLYINTIDLYEFTLESNISNKINQVIENIKNEIIILSKQIKNDDIVNNDIINGLLDI